MKIPFLMEFPLPYNTTFLVITSYISYLFFGDFLVNIYEAEVS